MTEPPAPGAFDVNGNILPGRLAEVIRRTAEARQR